MKRHKTILERITYGMDLNTEPIPKRPLAEIAGEHRVLIENHNGVTKYSCNEILARVSFGYFSINGEELQLLQMTNERLVIGGCIDSVSLIRKG